MTMTEDGNRNDAGDAETLATHELHDAVRRASVAFGALEERLAEAGGVAPVVELYDRIRAGMQRLEYAELDRVAGEIRDAIEILLRMDAAVRKLNNLKVMLDGEQRGDVDGAPR